jgi:chloramphenicol 3-O-phosphotransferase
VTAKRGQRSADMRSTLAEVSLLNTQPLVLITGISASGKSTVADLLARRFERGVHVKGDMFRRMVVAGRHEMTSAPSDEAWRQLRLRYRLGTATADAYHEAGFSVVVQDVVIGPVLADYVAAIRSTPLVVVVLIPRAEVVARREEARRKEAYHDGFNNVSELDVALREETPRIGLWLDNSDQNPDETVDEIIERGLDTGRVE